LQIGGMAGMDAEGYGGFNNRVDNRYLKTFGSAIMGTCMDMAIPRNSSESNQAIASMPPGGISPRL
jgi:type IV secretion system protein VirB10